MLRAISVFLLYGCSQLFAQSGGAPCPIKQVAAAGQKVLLLCERGDLFVSSDGGASWRASRPIQADQNIRAVALFEMGRGFAAGDGGLLLTTEDGAETWRAVPLPVRENLTSFWFLGDLGWLAGWSGVILHTRDGGKTWTEQQSGEQQSLDSIYFLDAEHGWAAGWVGTILRTADGGRTWEKSQAPQNTWSFESIYFRDRQNGWAVGFGGQILRSRDGGRTWERQEQPVHSALKWVAFDHAGRGWIAGDSGLLVSEDGGESWKVLPQEEQVFFRQIVPMKDSVWAVEQFGIFKQAGSEMKFSLLYAAQPVPPVEASPRPRRVFSPRTDR